MQKALLSGFLFLVAISVAAAIQCYVCKSSEEVGCEDPFEHAKANQKGYLKECNADFFEGKTGGSTPPANATFFCRKGVQHVREKKSIYRSCGWEPYYIEGRQCYFTSVLDVKTTQCQCFADGCNGSSSVSSTMFTIALFSLAGILLARA